MKRLTRMYLRYCIVFCLICLSGRALAQLGPGLDPTHGNPLTSMPISVVGGVPTDHRDRMDNEGYWIDSVQKKGLVVGLTVDMPLPFQEWNAAHYYNAVAFRSTELSVLFTTGKLHTTGDLPFSGKLHYNVELLGDQAADNITLVTNGSVHIDQAHPTMVVSLHVDAAKLGERRTMPMVGGGTRTFRKYTKYRLTVTGVSFDASLDPPSYAFSTALKTTLARVGLVQRTDAGIDATTSRIELVHPAYQSLQAQAVGGSVGEVSTPTTVFSWHVTANPTGLPIPGYRLQLRKLDNQLPNKQNLSTLQRARDQDSSERGLSIYLRKPGFEEGWRNALEFHADAGSTEQPIFINQGTGFYSWRIQPVSTLAQGPAFSSVRSLAWTGFTLPEPAAFSAFDQVSHVEYKRISRSFRGQAFDGLFYFLDVDSARNRIHARQFSEGSRAKEVAQYANGLDQLSQTQTFLPSQRITLTAHTVYDKSGRKVVETLPAPDAVEEGLTGFKPKHLLPKDRHGNEGFNADHFDATTTLSKPSRVASGQDDPFGFYGNAPFIDSAGGYPYKRTIFTPGTADQVREQSGFGRRHMIGNREGNKAKPTTTRTLYSVASQTELNRMFGKAAPRAENVRKNVTTDPNGTSTVKYTDLEGHLIATALGFYDKDILQDPTDDGDKQVVDSISANTVRSGTIIASEQVVFERRTSVKVDYVFKSRQDTLGCFALPIEKRFDVKVRIRKLDASPFRRVATVPTNEADVTPADYEAWLTQWIPTATMGWQYPATTASVESYSLETVPTAVSSLSVTRLNYPVLNLPAGSYLIEKVLVPKPGSTPLVSQASSLVQSQTKLFIDSLSAKLLRIDCQVSPAYLTDWLKGISTRLQTAATSSECSDPGSDECKALYKQIDIDFLGQHSGDPAFFKPGHRLTLYPTGPTAPIYPNRLLFSSSCCDIELPLEYPNPLLCQGNHLTAALTPASASGPLADDGKFKVNPYMGTKPQYTEFFPDFEGFAYAYFWDDAKKVVEAPGYKLNPYKLPGGAEVAFQTQYADTADKNLRYVFIDPTAADLDLDRKIVRHIWYNYLAPHMGGYTQAGTFNLMVQKMLTDHYQVDAFNRTFLTDTMGRTLYQYGTRGGTAPGDSVSIFPGGSTIIDLIAVRESPTAYYDPCLRKNVKPYYDRVIADAGIASEYPMSAAQPDTIYANTRLYDCRQLLGCWMAQLALIKNQADINRPVDFYGQLSGPQTQPGSHAADANGGYSISNQIDSENGGPGRQNNHLHDNIKVRNFFARLFGAARRIRRIIDRVSNMVRNTQVRPDGVALGPSPDPAPTEPQSQRCLAGSAVSDTNTMNRDSYCDTELCLDGACVYCDACSTRIVDQYQVQVKAEYHAVHEFLNCAGYRYATILTDKSWALSPRDQVGSSATQATVPNYGPDADAVNANCMVYTGTTQAITYDGTDRGYQSLTNWRGWSRKGEKDVFQWVRDPVYAYKYFEYKTDQYPELEINTCFRNPNLLRHSGGYAYAGSFDATISDSVIYWCERDKLLCPTTAANWSAGQRLAFLQALRVYTLPKQYTKAGELSLFTTNDLVSTGRFSMYGPATTPVYVPWDDSQRPYYYITTSPSFSSYRSRYGYLYYHGMREWGSTDRLLTYAELKADEANAQVASRCQEQAFEFRQKLAQSFLDSGYSIGPCISKCDSVITLQDLDSLATIYTQACMARGQVTTFRMDSSGCRSVYANYPTTLPAAVYVDKDGAALSLPDVILGVADSGSHENTLHGCREQKLMARDPCTSWPCTLSSTNSMPSRVFNPIYSDLTSSYTLTTETGFGPKPLLQCPAGTPNFREFARYREILSQRPQVISAHLDSVSTSIVHYDSTLTPATYGAQVDQCCPAQVRPLAGCKNCQPGEAVYPRLGNSFPVEISLGVAAAPVYGSRYSIPAEYVQVKAEIPRRNTGKTIIKKQTSILHGNRR